jgi:hypothetical protein
MIDPDQCQFAIAGLFSCQLRSHPVKPKADDFDHELDSLSRETRLVADAIEDAAIRARLIVIADGLLDLAHRSEKLNWQ